MKFTKEDFKKKYKATKLKAKTKVKEDDVDESDYGLKQSGHAYTHNEIQTDTQEIPGDTSSDFETDTPITTNKAAANFKNKGANMNRGGNMGVRHGVNNEGVEEIDEASRVKMKKMVQELLKQRTREDGFTPTEQPNDIHNTEIEKIPNIVLRTKTSELIKAMETSEKNEIQMVLSILNQKGNV